MAGKARRDAELESLMSHERLDRSSPDLWPGSGALLHDTNQFVSSSRGSLMHLSRDSSPEWLHSIKQDDTEMLHEFGSLTSSQLVEKVKALQNLAYQLGLEEAKEMTRGKFLNVLGVDKSNSK
ncbi:protein lin-52 homolog [Corticium candelabrum]|uniref:protein lin-52 homolog n=1 Tax=Corticium candelabrum TaxID=121492 RepID=UPI002E25AE66|nr:protein lin-52 homolog [Corticium candelabrum]